MVILWINNSDKDADKRFNNSKLDTISQTAESERRLNHGLEQSGEKRTPQTRRTYGTEAMLPGNLQ